MNAFTLKGRGKPVRGAGQKLLVFVILSIAVIGWNGCGTSKDRKKDHGFFTSGSREADQRAAQRMAKEEQLTGTGASSGEKKDEERKEEAQKQRTLYVRLGGQQGITAIVDDFTVRVLNDPRVNWTRRGSKPGGFFRFLRRERSEPAWNPTPQNVARLKTHMVQFLSLATGGPARYEGKEMKSAHANMAIDNSQFDAAIGDLKAALDNLRIPDQEQKELLAIVESTRPQIVSVR